ncbi:MAG: fluoride efflux transporter CrcB [Candidatus Aureabacteria bacterium]|nr:fluoride efflux transporter CrcB [Candidatus Auribacterota bacterium]
MTKVLFICFGGALGALLRYMVTGASHKVLPGIFPWGTLIVNLIGCFCIGFLWRLTETFSFSHNIRLFIFIGLLGSFTTFSTYGLECFQFLRDGQIRFFLFNILLNNILGICFVVAGVMGAGSIIKIFH